VSVSSCSTALEGRELPAELQLIATSRSIASFPSLCVKRAWAQTVLGYA
jgi:hypothetical protein